VPYEQLRLLLEERSSELEVLRNRLEQRDASMDALRKMYEAQVRCRGFCLRPLYGGVCAVHPSPNCMRACAVLPLRACPHTQAKRQQAEVQRLLAAAEAAAPHQDQRRPGSQLTLQRLAAEVRGARGWIQCRHTSCAGSMCLLKRTAPQSHTCVRHARTP
jgi:hypothetical protein